MKRKILIIDDDADLCMLLSNLLTRNGYETDTAHSGINGIKKFKENDFDAVICDFRLGDKKNGKDILLEIKSINPQAAVLIITAYSDIKTAVDVIKAGAYDYITKPMIPDEVLNVLGAALQQPTTSSAEKNEVPSSVKNTRKVNTNNSEFLVGEAPVTKSLYSQIDLVAPTNYCVILNGESGTGKEVVARTIHNRSKRKDKPFVAMDCGTLSNELAGSELFGHVKGSFTGAINEKEGHFELANGGTLFLDEVTNLSLEVQASLLRVIQERKYKRIGGVKEMDVDVRIIVATNENLHEACRIGKFREDLYHRFNEFSIHLPPLRNRQDDIPLFADFFLQHVNNELNKDIEGFDDDVMEMFINYSWPGNLREFRNVIRRCVLLTNSGKIAAHTLPMEISSSSVDNQNNASADNPNISVVKTSSLDLKDTASKAEYEAIMQVLKKVNYNKTKAAELLKIDRKTLYNKIRNYEDSI